MIFFFFPGFLVLFETRSLICFFVVIKICLQRVDFFNFVFNHDPVMLPFIISIVFYSHSGPYVLETNCIRSHFQDLKLVTMIVARFESRLELLRRNDCRIPYS